MITMQTSNHSKSPTETILERISKIRHEMVINRDDDLLNEERDEIVQELDTVLEHAICLSPDYSIFQKNRDLEDLRFSKKFTITAISLCNKAQRILHQHK